MRELSQRSGCRVPNVGGSEVGGSFMEPRDHSASELYVLLGERYICGLLHNFFFKGDHFSAQMGRLSAQKARSLLPDVSIFLRHPQRYNDNVKTHFSFSCSPFLTSHCVHYNIFLLPMAVPPSRFKTKKKQSMT